MSIASFEDANFETKTIETETATQVAPRLVDSTAQTQWKYPKNATTQYEPRCLDDAEKEKILESDSLANFLKESLPQ